MMAPIPLWDRTRKATIIRAPRRCLVYALLDPREPVQIRYVGYTFDTRQRLQQHISDASVAPNRGTRKTRWIASLLAEGVHPKLVVLEADVPPDLSLAREAYWITRSLRAGHDLTNDRKDDFVFSRGSKVQRPRVARRSGGATVAQ
jgi:hypothetical protein